VPNSGDCNDMDPGTNPNAPELCATGGVDNDCDGNSVEIDAGAADKVDYYRDADHDGFTVATTARFCPGTDNDGWQPAPSSPLDCNDNLITYADADMDGFGAGPMTACGVDNSTDCDDANAAINPNATEVCDAANTDEDCDGGADDVDPQDNATGKTTWYLDTDHDGYGVMGSTAMACDLPSGYAPIPGDVCPSNPTKQLSAGVCGCDLDDTDIDGDNRIDCVDIELELMAAEPFIDAAMPYVVRVRANTIDAILPMSGMQLAVKFDATRLSLDAVVPVAPEAGGPFGLPIATQIVNTPDANGEGSLRYAIGVDHDDVGFTQTAGIVDLVFSVKPGADLCAQDIRLARLAQVGTWRNLFVTFSSVGVTPEMFSLPVVDLDTTNPVIAGVPESVAIPADAGSAYGAFVAAPTVLTSDNCTDGLVADLLVTYPETLGTATAWPADGMFPVGVTTLEWTATDETGNVAQHVRTITVHDYQLLDLDVGFTSHQKGASLRTFRVSAGAHVQLVSDVLMPRWSGSTPSTASVTSIQLPVAAGYPCIAVKDTAHSISATAVPQIVGTRYKAAVTLKQGDTPNASSTQGDDKVDISDFSVFVANIGSPVATNAPSNFNGDTEINTADFASISINFFLRGDTCGGAAHDGSAPLSRISVKELRRQGLGHAAVADFNGDGWVDVRDIQIYMQGGQVHSTLHAPTDGVSENGWNSGW
jgi:hypothetical protein